MKNIPKLRFKEFTDEWEEKKLGELCNICTGKKDTQNKVENGKYPFFVRSQIVERINSYSFDGEAILTAGDGVGVGKVFHYINGKFDYHQRVYKLSDFKDCFGRFIFEKFKKDFIKEVKKYNAKTSVDSVRMEMITNMKIDIPTFREQEKIGNFLLNVDKKISIIEEKLNLFNEYKKGIMQKIFKQELRFKDKNGNDYPEWEEKRLGEIGIFYRGHSYNSSNVVDNGLLVLRSNNIQNNIINYDDLQFVNKDCKKEIILKDKDIIICMANGSKRLVGKTGEYKENLEYSKITVGAFCSIFRTNNKMAKFLFQTKNYYDEIALMLEGTNINNLKNSSLEEISFYIPPSIEEQEKIANFLSAIDIKIEKIYDELENLKEFKKGLLQKVLI